MTASLAYTALLGFAFCFPFSLPAGRGFLALAAVGVAVDAVRSRRCPRIPSVTWFALAFLSWTVWATVNGLAPELGMSKLDKLVWFIAIPVSSILVDTPSRLKRVLQAFALGVGVLALDVCLVRPIRALRCTSVDVATVLTDMGSMTDGQMLMLGLILVLAMLPMRKGEQAWFRSRVLAWGLPMLVGAGLVMNLKRGSWIVTAVLVSLLFAVQRKWRLLGVLVLVGAAVLLLPPVRQRMAGLCHEFDPAHGGRITMWTRVAPVLVHDHPMGIGYRSLTAHLMQRIARRDGFYVEPGRDHLHSNPVQLLVATGWLGLFLYGVWMVKAVWDAVRMPSRGVDSLTAQAMMFMLIGLLGNGLIEYNFGDAELVLAYGLIMGTAASRLS